MRAGRPSRNDGVDWRAHFAKRGGMTSSEKPPRTATTLDPDDWSAFRERAHAMLDLALSKMETAREGRVWTPVPDALQAELETGLQPGGRGAEAVDEALRTLMPHGVGNTHPRFMGWVHGAGTPSGIIPAMVEIAMNANCGGRDHVGLRVERQLTQWVRDLFGFPETASGLTVTGTSMATVVALKTARDAALDFATRTRGVQDAKLVGYTSAEAHACNARAFDILGLGSDALRLIPSDDAFRLDTAALKDAIAEDRKAGLVPFIVIATAGTVNTGMIDPLEAIADIAEAESLWMHVDGAFAASGIMSERLKPHLKAIARADSLAFDFHKWLHVNYDAGFVLIRHETLHRHAFSSRPDYLKGAARGLAAGNPWPVEYGPELSRGFRALKVWAQLLEYGPDRLGAAITANCELVQALAARVDADPRLERLAPVETSICCFRYVLPDLNAEELDALNDEIVTCLHEAGLAAPSTTRICGRLAIRVNITNHRTRNEDLDVLLDAIAALAPEALNTIRAPSRSG